MTLKTVRKSRYPKAADFLPVLLNHGVKYSLPEYSLFESGRAIPTKSNAKTICKCLECSLADVEEFTVFVGERATQGKLAATPRMIPGRGISFGDLPEGNRRLSVRVKPEIERQVNDDLERLGFDNWGQYCSREAIPKLHERAMFKKGRD